MSHADDDWPSVTDVRHEEPVELLRDLVRFDTTNPPGNERECIEWIGELLDAYGIDYETVAAEPERPNLVARLPGGDAPPLLLYGHVDVVPAEGDWTHPPFGGVLEDGSVWGRGALDMKAGVAMFLTTFLRCAAEEYAPAGDLLLCIVADEEAGGDLGLAYLVNEHPELFDSVEYALGEFGGFPIDVGGQRFYPIQVNEKQVCWLQARVSGPGGHGSNPSTDDAFARLARFVVALDESRLPVHIDPISEEMITTIANELSPPTSVLLRALLQPRLTNRVLDLLGEEARLFDAVTHNVANETIVRGGSKENVIPEEVTLTLDCRLLPGFTPEDVMAEIRDTVGPAAEHVEFDVIRYEEGPSETDTSLLPMLGDVLESVDEEATTIPLLLHGSSDARHLARIGIQSYGFTPMNLPPDFSLMDLVHAPDERIPADCVEWGSERVFEAVHRYEG